MKDGQHGNDAAGQLCSFTMISKMGARGSLCILAAFAFSVGLVSTDYVVTGPSPGPPLPLGQCPYVFKDVNIKYAQGFCPTGEHALRPSKRYPADLLSICFTYAFSETLIVLPEGRKYRGHASK